MLGGGDRVKKPLLNWFLVKKNRPVGLMERFAWFGLEAVTRIFSTEPDQTGLIGSRGYRLVPNGFFNPDCDKGVYQGFRIFGLR